MIHVQLGITAAIPSSYERHLPAMIDNIKEFVAMQFPEIVGRMNSPVIVTIKIVSDGPDQAGEL